MKISANGINVNYTLEGPASAPVVTMSHSLATDLSMWDPQLPAVLTSRYRVLRYDTRGHGGTEAPAGPYTLEALTEDVRALLQALGIARTHFIGLSMGGMIGQTLALQSPELLQSLVLCDTMSRMPTEAKPLWDERIHTAEMRGMEPLVEPTLARWFTAPFREQRPEVIEPVRSTIRTTPVAGYVGCCHAMMALNLTDRLNAITLPTLIIVGEDDPGTPVDASRTIHEQITGTSSTAFPKRSPIAASRIIHEQITGSELVILKSAAHLSNLEQPQAFNEALTTFLTRVAPLSARAGSA